MPDTFNRTRAGLDNLPRLVYLGDVGRSYWFECSKCGYRAKVSGRADRGLNFFVQTILCRDCKELYDAVVRVRTPDGSAGQRQAAAAAGPGLGRLGATANPPSFQSVASRLLYTGQSQFKWRSFKLQCPVSALHRVESWNNPDKCPKCGILLEKNVLPYRIWD